MEKGYYNTSDLFNMIFKDQLLLEEIYYFHDPNVVHKFGKVYDYEFEIKIKKIIHEGIVVHVIRYYDPNQNKIIVCGDKFDQLIPLNQSYKININRKSTHI